MKNAKLDTEPEINQTRTPTVQDFLISLSCLTPTPTANSLTVEAAV
jgi:hypothetical protein